MWFVNVIVMLANMEKAHLLLANVNAGCLAKTGQADVLLGILFDEFVDVLEGLHPQLRDPPDGDRVSEEVLQKHSSHVRQQLVHVGEHERHPGRRTDGAYHQRVPATRALLGGINVFLDYISGV